MTSRRRNMIARQRNTTRRREDERTARHHKTPLGRLMSGSQSPCRRNRRRVPAVPCGSNFNLRTLRVSGKSIITPFMRRIVRNGRRPRWERATRRSRFGTAEEMTPLHKSVQRGLRRCASAPASFVRFWDRMRSVFVERAAEILGVSRRTVYYRIREGRLRTIRTRCGSQRVLVDSIEELLRAGRTRSATGVVDGSDNQPEPVSSVQRISSMV